RPEAPPVTRAAISPSGVTNRAPRVMEILPSGSRAEPDDGALWVGGGPRVPPHADEVGGSQRLTLERSFGTHARQVPGRTGLVVSPLRRARIPQGSKRQRLLLYFGSIHRGRAC